ncbi:MAG: toll/interleukin-1 receptor domain-containing protein [Chloroflexi bacterium]|nr:MAG: toll/interleukin-1 receptor domain-containing protein [Chloroflexota bacterium]
MTYDETTTNGTPNGQWQVFISYSWQTTHALAKQLHTALTRQGVLVYLDSDEIGPGEPIRRNVFEALLNARVMVAYVDPVYFSRRYCQEEWATALAAYRSIVRQGGSLAERALALTSIVVVQPIAAPNSELISHIPTELLDTRWPAADETDTIANVVRHRLIDQPITFGERLIRLNELDSLRDWLYRPAAFRVALNLPGGHQLVGAWEPDEQERRASWELYVELQSRVAVVGRPGTFREALSSLHSLFSTSRSLLRSYGPSIARPKGASDLSFGHVAFVMINDILRPLLWEWHIRLLDYETSRGPDDSPREHELRWQYADDFQTAFDEAQLRLRGLADLLKRVAEVP